MTVAPCPASVPLVLDRSTIGRITGLRPRQLDTTHQLPSPPVRHSWHLAVIRQWAADNGLPASMFAGPAAMPLVIGKFGICVLFGITENVYKRWRREPGMLPEPDMVIDSRPLWWGATIHAWAKARTLQSHLMGEAALAAGSAELVVQEPLPVWGMAGIADATGLKEPTVRTRLRWYYNTAVEQDVWPLPLSALPADDLCPDGVPLWFPQTITSWMAQAGRLDDPDAAAEPVIVLPADPVQVLVGQGKLWTKNMIAKRLNVTPKAVERWGRAGLHFPYPVDSLADGTPVWDPRLVEHWAEMEKRLANGEAVRKKAGRRPKALDEAWAREKVGFSQEADLRQLAARVREALNEQFPRVQFLTNVTVSAGKPVLRLTWTDGPSLGAMATAQQYNPLFDGFASVLKRRHLSADYREQLATQVATLTGKKFSPGKIYTVDLDGGRFAGTGKELMMALAER